MESKCHSACYLVDGELMVDFPGGTCQELRRRGIDPMAVNYVLLTHIHGDHTLGLPVWYLEKTKHPSGKCAPGFHVYAYGDTLKQLQDLTYASFPTSFTERKMRDVYTGWHGENRFTCGELDVERIPAVHGELRDCCGYVIRKGGKTVGFTGDTCLTETVTDLVKICDVLLCDCDLVVGNRKHMGINDLAELARINPSCRIIASHLKDSTREALLQMGQDRITAGTDGMEIDC